jgi:hypothetical protein
MFLSKCFINFDWLIHRHLGFGAQNAFKIQIKCIFVNPSTCTGHIYQKNLILAVLKKIIFQHLYYIWSVHVLGLTNMHFIWILKCLWTYIAALLFLTVLTCLYFYLHILTYCPVQNCSIVTREMCKWPKSSVGRAAE